MTTTGVIGDEETASRAMSEGMFGEHRTVRPGKKGE